MPGFPGRDHLPTQKRAKSSSRRSAGTASPRTVPRWRSASRRSTARRSGGASAIPAASSSARAAGTSAAAWRSLTDGASWRLGVAGGQSVEPLAAHDGEVEPRPVPGVPVRDEVDLRPEDQIEPSPAGRQDVGEGLILVRPAPRRVDEHPNLVGVLHRAVGAGDALRLDALVGHAHAGGIDEHEPRRAERDRLLQGVPRGSGNVGDDRALPADEGVEERRLARVGPSDERDPTSSAREVDRAPLAGEKAEPVGKIPRARRDDGRIEIPELLREVDPRLDLG